MVLSSAFAASPPFDGVNVDAALVLLL